ncbi:MAG: ATP-dependent Clp protease proteolytic subunit [Candidatus Methanoperedens sp.]|nr:ATP-dependent Clp protease proteolytic subunit [Candidatus Methanoperedens sp.]
MKKLLILAIAILFLCAISATFAGDGKRIKDTFPELPYTAFTMPDKTMFYNLQGGIGMSEAYHITQVFAVMEGIGSKKLVLILNSPGGNVFDGLAVASIINEKSKQGIEIEVRGYGIIASAATLVFVSGTKGKRFMHEDALFMVHSIGTFKFFEFSDLVKDEKELAVKKLIQSKLNAFVARMTGMKVEDLNKLIMQETWITAPEAVRLGFADKTI